MGGFSDVRATESRYTSVIEGRTIGAWVSSLVGSKELAFLAEQRRTDMFVTVSTYRAKAGEEDAIIALHEAWQRTQHIRTRGYLSGELLRSASDAGQFIARARR